MDDIKDLLDSVFDNFDFEYKLADAFDFLFMRTIVNDASLSALRKIVFEEQLLTKEQMNKKYTELFHAYLKDAMADYTSKFGTPRSQSSLGETEIS